MRWVLIKASLMANLSWSPLTYLHKTARLKLNGSNKKLTTLVEFNATKWKQIKHLKRQRALANANAQANCNA
jgi:hypothetical protein